MLGALSFLFNVVVGYLVGSICSAVIVCRLFDLPDPRTEGSRNPGATNVLRIAGKQYAVIVLLGDMLKGVLPVLLAKLLGGGAVIVGFTCLATVVGHMYPVFFEFKGGKGVATAIGALLGFHFLLGVAVLVTWILVANFTRYSSLASIVAMILAPFYSIFAVHGINAFPPLALITLLILYKHRDNITRLIDGNESKLNFRSKAANNDMNSIPNSDNLKPAKTTRKATGKKPATTAKKAANKKPAKAKKPAATKTPKNKVT